MSDSDKNIDEGWKAEAGKEKDKLKDGEDFVPQTPDFNFFVTTLGLQAAVNLGQMPNPATNIKEENMPQAKFIIDTLQMLQEKTKGNLTPGETGLLENLLYELRMQYVSKTEGGSR